MIPFKQQAKKKTINSIYKKKKYNYSPKAVKGWKYSP